MRPEADSLDRMNLSMIGIYAERSKQAHEPIAARMRAETWFTAKDALELGFADEIEQPTKMAALFDVDRLYASTPEALRDAAIWERAIAKVQL